MDFGGTLIFEGRNGLRFIKSNEDGLIDLVFGNEQGGEVVLEFEPELFAEIARKIRGFQESGDSSLNVGAHCRVTPDIFLDIDGEKNLTLNVDLKELENAAIFKITSRKGNLDLIISKDQGGILADRMNKIAQIETLEEEVQKKASLNASL